MLAFNKNLLFSSTISIVRNFQLFMKNNFNQKNSKNINKRYVKWNTPLLNTKVQV